ncbi:MAG: hypothetical protein BGO21_10200 [Dyadobacter sp. 50-39]|uniref:DUF6934 family protein n=1 Tax=Dyadobacter sp. 50-39 TaxID=1895756 RepID=UPI000964AD7B|nr:hypothetical protein [Dyadobacter sp. 50-39]OJV21239.1 MAG: hypothetical protein BGO21_10200 [Dyadobacter sp. 50-39]
MDIIPYPTYETGSLEYSFYSVGHTGVIELRMRITLMDAGTRFYNIGFGVWELWREDINDKTTIRNGDTDRILATVSQKALEFLRQNPEANIAATGSVLPGEMPLRTRKYQMGISKYYSELSEFCNIYGFKANKVDGVIMGEWPDWDGKWVRFVPGTNYDAFLLNLKK